MQLDKEGLPGVSRPDGERRTSSLANQTTEHPSIELDVMKG